MKLSELKEENRKLKEKVKFFRMKEGMSFLKYMLVSNATKNRFINKKLTEEERNKFTVELRTYEEMKRMWEEYMGFKWEGELDESDII